MSYPLQYVLTLLVALLKQCLYVKYVKQKLRIASVELRTQVNV